MTLPKLADKNQRERTRQTALKPVSSISGMGPNHHSGPPLRPRKSLGQNFLRDENVIRKIVRAIGPHPTDVMLEIGPGEGALTKHLAHTVKRLIVVDVDERVTGRMRELFPEVEVVHNDILEVDLDERARHNGGPLRVVGNIPYNITSPILFLLLDHRTSVSDVTLMVQKEVARRLVAKPGVKDYGILSVSFQLFTDVEILFDVSRNAFYPKPDVTSSMIRLTMLTTPRHPLADEQVFRSMVRSIFGKRRKMLRASMKYFCGEHGYILPATFDLTRRPEELSIAELVRMSNVLVEAAANG